MKYSFVQHHGEGYVDGDVTASIRVDSITPLSDGKHAKGNIYRKGSSNNITTAKPGC